MIPDHTIFHDITDNEFLLFACTQITIFVYIKFVFSIRNKDNLFFLNRTCQLYENDSHAEKVKTKNKLFLHTIYI